MGNAIAVVSQLSLSDLWKYVFNSMECHSNCCHDVIQCDCATNEVEIPSDDSDSKFNLCGLCDKAVSDTSTSDDCSIISKEKI